MHAVFVHDMAKGLGRLLQDCLPLHSKESTARETIDCEIIGLLYLQVAHRAQAAHARVLHAGAARSNCMQRIVGQVHRSVASVGLWCSVMVVPQPQQRLIAGQLMPVNVRGPSVLSSEPRAAQHLNWAQECNEYCEET